MKRKLPLLILILLSLTPLQAHWWDDLFGISHPVGFVPDYCDQQFVYSPDNHGGTIKVPINIRYCVTPATADWLLAKYVPGGKVAVVPFQGAGGPVTSTAIERDLVWPDGFGRMNAGFLAGMYTNNPEQQFPKLAEKMCVRMIAAIGEVPPPGVGLMAIKKVKKK